ncbi:MAG: hypothetical protein KJN72_13405, partial [Woeseia sp.]|nr:hypothetical protein [Woeseia sp.]
MSKFSVAAVAQPICVCALLLFAGSSMSQGIPEDRNINIVGVNPPTAGSPVPDNGLKQQNEPSCAMKPSNPLHILCAFNDYRGVDNPAIGDAWEGYSYSINGGQTWFSDLLPGHPGDSQSLGLSFAADPQVAAAPGVALIAYIAADRSENADGGLFLQQMFEVNREAGAPWVPALAPIEVAKGKAKKFIDKPFMYLHPAPAGSGTVTVSAVLEDGTSISQEAPAARLFLAHTEFSGTADSPKSTMIISRSDDYGESWKTEKLQIGNNDADSDSDSDSAASGGGASGGNSGRPNPLNQSASIAAIGDNVCIVWRRFAGGDEDDAILAACSDDRGKKFENAIVVSAPPDYIPFDQGTTEASFRVNSYPFITTDGEKFYAFWASRKPIPDPLFYSRIVYSVSDDGSSWSPPAVLDDAADGHQFMPVASAARGTIQVAWYDTRNNLFQADFIQDLPGSGGIPDEDSQKIIRNKADIRTLQIKNGVPTNSVQVSRYAEGALAPGETPTQLEFNFLNDRLFKQGTVPFVGDYPHVAAATFRQENGQWVSNIPADATNKEADFLISWSDNRDVRGNVWEDLETPTTYTPPAASSSKNSGDEPEATDPQGPVDPMFAGNRGDSEGSITSAAIADGASADAEPDLTPETGYGACQPGTYQDRTRNQNVYSSIIRPGVSIDSPSASKPTGAIQRSHVIWVSNNETTDQTYTLRIENQPPDAGVNGRASFLQVPVAPFQSTAGLLTEIAVAISANSTIARTVYVTSNTQDPEIVVSVSDGGAVTFGTITLNADVLSPDIQNPDVQNPDPQNPDIQNAEVHNPDIQNVVITRVENPDVQNPDIQNPDIQNPDVQNPDFQNPDIQNPD